MCMCVCNSASKGIVVRVLTCTSSGWNEPKLQEITTLCLCALR